VEFIAGYVMGARMAGRAGRLAASAEIMSQPTTAGKHLDLDERLDRLAVVVEAMWALLEEKGYSAEHLEAKVGELSTHLIETPIASATQCRKCEALVPRAMDHCQFCGEPTAGGTPFAGLAN
jgi:hypothetical protein